MALLLFCCSLGVSLQAQLVTYTFTNCGATGQNGPSQAQVNAAYLSTNLNGSVTVTGGIQQFTVPVGGMYRFEVAGSAAGGNSTNFGGRGRIVRGDIMLTAGQVIRILVGQKSVTGSTSTGGGGGTYVCTITNSIIAIGGGGGGYCNPLNIAVPTSDGNFGNNGLAATGSNPGPGGTGGSGGSGALSEWGGGGGGWSGNGTQGSACSGTGGMGFLNGGMGGGTCNNSTGGFGGGGGTHGNTGGGGGGGGYSGGGGSGQSSGNNCGGGGGSFLSPQMVNTADLGTNVNDGRVVITRLCNINLFVSGVNASGALCSGSSATITTDAISNYTWSTGSNASSIVVSPTTTTVYSLTATSPSNCVTTAVTTLVVSGAAPVLTITASSNSVCLGNTVSLLATGAISYTWSGGVTNGVAFSPTATTTYSVAGANGCGIANGSQLITLAPLPVTGISSASVVCSGNTATLSAGGATSYTWSPGNITGATALVSPISNTTYTLVGSTGNCLGVFTLNIATNPNPTITTSASNSMICQGESATLTANGALGYTWQPGNLTGASIVVSPSTPTAYIVTGNNSFGCTSSVQQPVIAFAAPTINISSPSPTICSGGTAILNASGANSYTWSTGPNTSSISVNPSSTTIYTVAGTNTTTQCSSTNTFEVNVFVPNVTVSSSTAVCIGESITLNASGANSYQWSTGGTGSSILVTPNSTTTYTVTGLANAGNLSCSGSAVTTVTVNPLPTVTAAATRSNICRNESTTINASGASTYLWGNAATTASITVSPTINTTYSVVGTDANGCKNSANIFIRVYGCVGLDENSAAANLIQVYPNPNNGVFYVQANEDLELILVNELGQLVQEIRLQASNAYSAEVRNLASGLYFIKSANPELGISKKLMVQN